MVGANTGRNIGAEVFAAKAGGMAINDLLSGEFNFVEYTGVTINYAGEIHYLSQPDAALPVEELTNILGRNSGS